MRIGVLSVVAAVIQLLLESLSCHCSWIMERILIRYQGNGSSRCDDKKYFDSASKLKREENVRGLRPPDDWRTSDNEN